MSKREEFVSLINDFKAVSPTISEEQHKGLLRRAVNQFNLAVEEAVDILNVSGLVIGKHIDYFDVLGLTITEIETLSDAAIVDIVETAHKRLYVASLNAGGRPRADGRTEEQWRIFLNQAKRTLIDPQKRMSYLKSLDIFEETKGNLSAPLYLENMVLIPSGEFKMGGSDNEASVDEKPVHTVFLDEFYIDKYPVTNAQYKAFVDANPDWGKPKWLMRFLPSKFHDGFYLDNWEENFYPTDKAEHPVICVSWYAAMAYAEWVGKRLPTEAEWEKAARGGLVQQKYPWGDVIDTAMANFGNNIGSTTAVGEYPHNGYHVYDMAGNVWEWCLDEWDDNYYISSPDVNPVSGGRIQGITYNMINSKGMRLIRGGSWYNNAQNIRVAKRTAQLPTYSNANIGFRCVKTISS